LPAYGLDLVSDGRLVDIVAEGFDAGVRLQEMVPQDMVIVPFGGDVRFLAVAARGYLADNGAPMTPDDLHRHRCIRQRLPSGKLYRWEFARNAEELAIDAPGALTLDHNGLMVETAEAGLGIAFVPEPFARQALEEGRLVALLAEWSPAIPGLCLYYPGHRHAPPALRAFIEELRSAQRRYAAV
jgi:DNA-binding transcriptional LysR family regulator